MVGYIFFLYVKKVGSMDFRIVLNDITALFFDNPLGCKTDGIFYFVVMLMILFISLWGEKKPSCLGFLTLFWI
jgi:hypothetical protein